MNLILGVYSKFEPIIYDEVKSVIDNFSLKRNVPIASGILFPNVYFWICPGQDGSYYWSHCRRWELGHCGVGRSGAKGCKIEFIQIDWICRMLPNNHNKLTK